MKMRKLSENFIRDLNEGILKPLGDMVKSDHTLDLEIREDYINLYYRGGNILRLKEDKRIGVYKGFFDEKYLGAGNINGVTPQIIPNGQSIEDLKMTGKWVKIIPLLKQEMDYWFCKHHKDEREYQQLVVRENNYAGKKSNSTDYFICDIEYAASGKTLKNSGRYDLIAIKWTNKKVLEAKEEWVDYDNLRLAIIEMKYGDGALGGKAGLLKHLHDIDAFLSDNTNKELLKENAKSMLNQKNCLPDLGGLDLLESSQKKPIISLSSMKPELIFLLANHNPRSTKLWTELSQLDGKTFHNFEFKFALSSFAGYALYESNMLTLGERKDLFTKLK